MKRPDGKSDRAIRIRTALLGWDLWVGVASGLIMFLYAALTDNFEGGKAYFLAAAPVSVALSLGVWVGGRWVFDRMRSDDYGELIRLVDPEQFALMFPYHLNAIVALASAAWSAFGAITIDAIQSRLLTAAVYSISLALFVWALAGALHLYRLSLRHMRRSSQIQAMREQLEADERQTGRDRENRT